MTARTLLGWTLWLCSLSLGVATAASAEEAEPQRAVDASVQAPAPAPLPDAGTQAVAESPPPPGHEPELSVQVSPDHGLMTGDAARLVIQAKIPTGDDINILPQDFPGFEIIDRTSKKEPSSGGRDRHRFELSLVAVEPGDHALGPIRVRTVTPSGEVGITRTESVTARVGTLTGNEPNAEPKPATKPLPVIEPDYTMLWILGSVALAALIALLTLLIARWWRRRPVVAAPPPPPRPPWDVALEQLNALQFSRAQLFTEGRVVEWVDRLSDTLRVYLGHRYAFDGLESTTDEVIAHLRKSTAIGVAVPQIVALLGDCDLVKFAKADPGEALAEQMLAGAFHIVRTTMPAALPPVSAPATWSGPGPTSPVTLQGGPR